MEEVFLATLSGSSLIKLGEDISMRFVLRNKTNDNLYVLRACTLLEGLSSDCLEVKKDGEKLPYEGKMVKRREPTPAGYTLLQASDEIVVEFNLNDAYPIYSPGQYTVSLNMKIIDYAREVEVTNLVEQAAKAKTQPTSYPLMVSPVTFKVDPGEAPKLTEMGRVLAAERARKAKKKAPKSSEEDRPLHPNFEGGTKEQRETTRTAHDNGYTYILNSVSKLASEDPLYVTWFGEKTETRFNIVKGNYSSLEDGMENTEFTYNLTGEGCQADWYAYTFKGVTTVWMCAGFWTAPPTGNNSQAGVVVHELSHAVCYTDDIVYGQSACLRLAEEKPDEAIKNADNYEYFSENA